MNIIFVILIFGVIIAFHEFGHFLVAKLNHVGVTEFAIGLGPAIFSFTKKETKYSIRLIPMGGYCLMVGEDEIVDAENSFSNKSVLARMAIVLAGPVFNFILAFIFSIVLIHFTGCDPADIQYVAEGSAAEEAGIQEGDKLLRINGSRIFNYRELLLHMQLEKDGRPVELTFEKPDGERYTVTVTPKLNQKGEYKLGLGGGYTKSENIGTDIAYAGLELRYWVKATLTSLRMIFQGKVKSKDVMGPVGVGGVINDMIEEVKDESETKKEAVINVLLNLLNWCVLLSVNLGIMNLLPIPALDGGRLLFLIIEAIRRKRIPQEKEAIVNLIGFVLVICLMVVVFFNDIRNVFF